MCWSKMINDENMAYRYENNLIDIVTVVALVPSLDLLMKTLIWLLMNNHACFYPFKFLHLFCYFLVNDDQ